MAITSVLLDLDGVIRHFDPERRAAIEARHGLSADTLWSTAFGEDLATAAVTGILTRAQWIDEIAARVGSRSAVSEWLSDRGAADEAMLVECDRLRAAGYTVAILTNGTDTIAEEMAELGIDRRVDAVFNTWDIGYAKPDPRAFRHCCSALGVDPTNVFFTDDSESKLAGAVEIGMIARRFVGIDSFRRDLVEVGIG